MLKNTFKIIMKKYKILTKYVQNIFKYFKYLKIFNSLHSI
jgi:hypothetical protein